MKFLIITQKVDRNDSILGFFHRWLQEFAKNADHVTVIGQKVGAYDLPANVSVLSLGKETGRSRPGQIVRFWWLQWKLRSEYDRVLVHMTPIWIVIGCPIWFLLRKKMYLWYEARGRGWVLTVALLCVQKVFSASSRGMPCKTAKSRVVGHGIDTEHFRSSGAYDKGLAVAVGRITRAKHLEAVVSCFHSFPESSRLVIVGEAITTQDKALVKSLQDSFHQLGVHDRIEIRALRQGQLVSLLQRAQIFLHASETPLDKAILEAMACGCPVVSCSEAAKLVLPEICLATKETMAEHAEQILTLQPKQRDELSHDLRQRVVKDHSLPQLVERLLSEMQ